MFSPLRFRHFTKSVEFCSSAIRITSAGGQFGQFLRASPRLSQQVALLQWSCLISQLVVSCSVESQQTVGECSWPAGHSQKHCTWTKLDSPGTQFSAFNKERGFASMGNDQDKAPEEGPPNGASPKDRAAPSENVQPHEPVVAREGESMKGAGDGKQHLKLTSEGGEGREQSDTRRKRVGEQRFKLTDTVLLVVSKGDITKWTIDGKRDAIVNAANERMLGGGGVDGAIHAAAGPELFQLCLRVPEVRRGVRCPTGEAKTTLAGHLPVKYVIHTVGPIYSRWRDSECQHLLYSAYKSSLEEAIKNSVKYISFPAISCGVYGYPEDKAAWIALKAVRENAGSLKEVHFVLFNEDIRKVWLEAAKASLQPVTE